MALGWGREASAKAANAVARANATGENSAATPDRSVAIRAIHDGLTHLARISIDPSTDDRTTRYLAYEAPSQQEDPICDHLRNLRLLWGVPRSVEARAHARHCATRLVVPCVQVKFCLRNTKEISVTTSLPEIHPRRLWKHFDAIRQIPRPSGDEQKVAAYVEAVARDRAWTVKRDAAGNLCLCVPATAGRENVPPLALQAHLDMVCEKREDRDFDFTQQPIEAVLEGDWVSSRDTTLGADNGIGVSAALAICEDPDTSHGPVEILLTVDEEGTGAGAAGLDPSLLSARRMINLDAEREGALVVGCAGGCSTEIDFAARRAAIPKGSVPFLFRVSGLTGGHSGLLIQSNRGNAIKLLARVLARILAKCDATIWNLEGGNKHNSIPREAHALVYLPAQVVEQARQLVELSFQEFRSEVGPVDPGIQLSIRDIEPQTLLPFDCSSTRRLIRLLMALPHGVHGMSRDVPTMVETSINLATVHSDVDRVHVVMSSRSLAASGLRCLLDQVDATARLAGADTTEIGFYPPWYARPDSPLVSVAAAACREVFGSAPPQVSIHAGLECGLITPKFDSFDIVSIGPLIEGAHAPGERVSVQSVQRLYRVLGLIFSDR